ncbi:unnamed protein product, partial [Aureobasidium vineae]
PTPGSLHTMNNSTIPITDNTKKEPTYTLPSANPPRTDNFMPALPQDSKPYHSLGPLITIRILSPNIDPSSTSHFTTTWKTMRIRQPFSKIMTSGAGYWWEENRNWLHAEQTPDEVALKHGHTVRVVFCTEPEGPADVLDVHFEKKEMGEYFEWEN